MIDLKRFINGGPGRSVILFFLFGHSLSIILAQDRENSYLQQAGLNVSRLRR